MIRRICNYPVPGWVIAGLLLGGLAWALHDWLPPQPRWTAAGHIEWFPFSPDATRVLTVSWIGERHCGPMHVRDVATGRTLHQWGEPADQVLVDRTSADFCRWAGLVTQAGDPAPRLWVVNLETGEHHVRPFTLEPGWVIAHIELHGELVAVMTSPILNDRPLLNVGRIHIIDTETGRVVARLPWHGALVEFTPDGGHFLHEYRRAQGGEHVVGIWDTRTRQTVATAALPSTNTPWLTGDGKALYVTAGVGDHTRSMLIDLPSGRRRDLFVADVPHMTRVSADRRLLALVPHLPGAADCTVHVFDIASGAKRGVIPVRSKVDVVFSDDGRRLCVIDEPAGTTRFRMVDTATCAVLWEQPRREYPRAHSFFTPDRSTFVVWSRSDASMMLLEADTGELQSTMQLGPSPGVMELPDGGLTPRMHGPFLDASSWMPAPWTAPEKSFVARLLEDWLRITLDEKPTYQTTIIDTRTGQVAFRSDGDIFKNAQLTPDGQSLLASADGDMIRCYDAPEHRPWPLILGIPLGLGVVLFAIRAGWRRWRHRTATPQGAPP